ncbi:MAG: MobA/MobL family protein [Halomonas sp.]|nr:MobA/MobL family protein [Halomonas sp.]
MALYSLHTSAISRKSGRSATAAAAYRAGVEIVDERTGQEHDYTKKRGVEHVELFAKEGITLDSPSALWNAAEKAEKRKDGRAAREVLVALPAELNADARLALARQMTADLVERYGVAAQLAIHAPDAKGDQRNHHCHILITTRRWNHDGPGAKSQLEMSNTQLKKAGLPKSADELTAMRERWATMQNTALERADVAARVDNRSLAAQNIDRVPQIHQGGYATDMIRNGTPEQSDRATLNLEIISTNAEVAELREKLHKEQQQEAQRQQEAERIAAAEKARQEAAEKAAQEKAERERQELEAAAKAAQKRAEREAAEKAAQEKAERERQELEAAAKAAQERAERERQEREAAEKAAQEKARPLRDQVRDASLSVHAIDAEIKQLDDERQKKSVFKFKVRRALQARIDDLQTQRQAAYADYVELKAAYDEEQAAPSGRDALRAVAAKIRKERPGVAAETEKTVEQPTSKEQKSEQPAPKKHPKLAFDSRQRAIEIIQMESAGERAGAFKAASKLEIEDHDALVDELIELLDPLSGELTPEGQRLRAELLPGEKANPQRAQHVKSGPSWDPPGSSGGPGS